MSNYFYTKLAPHYDKIYSYVDYKQQAAFFEKVLQHFEVQSRNLFLDVCCGTGSHIKYLSNYFTKSYGVDISNEMIEQAQIKNSNATFIAAPMQSFFIDLKFDFILCYFNSIHYNTDFSSLYATIMNFKNHLAPNGLILFDMVDKSIGINSKKLSFTYEEKDFKIVFEPEWKYSFGDQYMDLFVDFTVTEHDIQHYNDHHITGPFTFCDFKSLAKQLSLSIDFFERNHQKIQGLDLNTAASMGICVLKHL